MQFDFELILFWAVVITGVISLVDIFFLAKKRKLKQPPQTKLPWIIDYARAFFPMLLLVFFLRSFLYEFYRIPSGSLEPTLAIGDFILVNKYHYGIRLPLIHTKIYPFHNPNRGDIIVFHFPSDPIYYIKRVIGLPGDHISYINKILYINDKEIPQTFVKNASEEDEEGNLSDVREKQEDLFGVKHAIYQNPDRPNDNYYDIVVPPGMYFMMGDNRDDSADSRVRGFVEDQGIVGQADYVVMSIDWNKHTIRWPRIGQRIE